MPAICTEKVAVVKLFPIRRKESCMRAPRMSDILKIVLLSFALEGCMTFSPDKMVYKNIDKTVGRREATCAVSAPRDSLVITPIVKEYTAPGSMSFLVTRRILVDSMVILTTTVRRTTKKILRDNGGDRMGYLSLGIVFGGSGIWCAARGSVGGLSLGGLCFALSYTTLRAYLSLADSNSTVVRIDTLGVKHILLDEIHLSNARVTIDYDGDLASPEEIRLDERGCGTLSVPALVRKDFQGRTVGTLHWKNVEAPVRLPSEICENEVRTIINNGDWKHLESVVRRRDLPSETLKLATSALVDHRVSQRRKPSLVWHGVSYEIQSALTAEMNSKEFDYFSTAYEKFGVSDIQINFEYSEDRGAAVGLSLTAKSLGMLKDLGGGRSLWIPTMSVNSAVNALIGMGFVANYQSILAGDYLSDALKNVRVTLRTRIDSSYAVTLWLKVYPRQMRPPLFMYAGQIEITHSVVATGKGTGKMKIEDRLIPVQYKMDYGFLLPNTTDYSGNKNKAVDLLTSLIRRSQ